MIKIIYFYLLASLISAHILQNNKNVTVKRSTKPEYYISTEAVSFVQAWSFCENYGMNFISFGNDLENARLLETIDGLGLAKPANFWVGGIYLKNDLVTKWYWVNEDDFVYTNWYSSSLVSGDNCIRWDYTTSTASNGKWYSASCSTLYKFICKN